MNTHSRQLLKNKRGSLYPRNPGCQGGQGQFPSENWPARGADWAHVAAVCCPTWVRHQGTGAGKEAGAPPRPRPLPSWAESGQTHRRTITSRCKNKPHQVSHCPPNPSLLSQPSQQPKGLAWPPENLQSPRRGRSWAAPSPSSHFWVHRMVPGGTRRVCTHGGGGPPRQPRARARPRGDRAVWSSWWFLRCWTSTE